MTYNLGQEGNKDASGHNYYERITRLTSKYVAKTLKTLMYQRKTTD